ncbi:MAG: YdiU family protein [Actinomycetota bacterium]|nr:YdiU family protein [Actinomycetota bacterium]
MDVTPNDMPNVTTATELHLDNWFVRDLEGMYEPWTATVASAPRLLVLNRALATELGIDAEWLASPDGVATLVGNAVPAGATPVAQAYSGHQFGGFSPRLGDGRALLLGELLGPEGERRDLHLKGSGRTPFARGGDGKAAVGPMLREYLMGEAMHSLGIPTTRALAVVATGDPVVRDTVLPGAVLARVAASHLPVGTFQYAAAHLDTATVRRVADHAIARHYPHVAAAANPYLALLEAVVRAQAELVARWMLVGFIHGVMNTDNTTISGETIDYGPCAFMDAYDPATVFSSIDHGGRYAFGTQPQVVQWNLARLAETLLPLVHEQSDQAVELALEALRRFPADFDEVWSAGMRAKLGLAHPADDGQLVNDLFVLLHAQQIDHTTFFRLLSSAASGDAQPVRSLFDDPGAFESWSAAWTDRLHQERRPSAEVAAGMNLVNPVYIPRNHLVEEALDAASTHDDLAPLRRLLDAITQPFTERPGFEAFAEPAPASFGRHQTFCGT